MIRAVHPQSIETSANTISQPTATSSPAVSRSVKPSRKPKGSHSVQGGSSEANRQAVVILEVLAGVKTPTQAASDLGISLPRYYQLETRALEGLVAALEPKPKGKQPLPANQIAALQRELDQARRACARQQALARVAQRTLAVKLAPRPKPKPVATTPSKSPEPGAGRRRKRRPRCGPSRPCRRCGKTLSPRKVKQYNNQRPARLPLHVSQCRWACRSMGDRLEGPHSRRRRGAGAAG